MTDRHKEDLEYIRETLERHNRLSIKHTAQNDYVKATGHLHGAACVVIDYINMQKKIDKELTNGN